MLLYCNNKFHFKSEMNKSNQESRSFNYLCTRKAILWSILWMTKKIQGNPKSSFGPLFAG